MGQRAAIWTLALGQTLGYACLYYIFAALVLSWQTDLGWSKSTLAMGPTLAIVLSGGLAPFMGRLVDRGYSRALLTAGPLLGALALALLASSRTQAVYLFAWGLIGLAQSASLYEVAFAFLVRRLGAAARAAIVRVTLVAGFASTIAFPAGAYLSDIWGWRGAVWCAAAVALFLIAPLHWWSAGVIRKGGPVQSKDDVARDKAALRRAIGRAAFWVLGGLLALIALNHWMMVAFFVPSFVELGASEHLAVLAAACVGPAQVVGRLALLRVENGMSNQTVLALCLGAMGLAVLLLIGAGMAPALALGYAAVQGGAIGIMTILRPVLIAETLGPEGYGTIAGTVQVMPLLAGAAAPMLGALVLTAMGVPGLIAVSAVLVLLAGGAALWLRRA